MPRDDKRSKELTQEEIHAQDEKFRTFFSTSVAQVPEAMKRRQEEEKKETRGGLGRLFPPRKGSSVRRGSRSSHGTAPRPARSCWGRRKSRMQGWNWRWNPESWRTSSR